MSPRPKQKTVVPNDTTGDAEPAPGALDSALQTRNGGTRDVQNSQLRVNEYLLAESANRGCSTSSCSASSNVIE